METQIFPVQNPQFRSYWNRPGGKFGTIAGLGVVAIVTYFVFPILTTMAWNALNLGIALVCLGLFLYMITHRKLRMSLFYFYEIMMKKLVGLVIQLDPIVVAETYVDEMEEEREKLYRKSIDVDAQKEGIDLKIKDKQRELNKLILRAHTAKEKGMMPELTNITRQIGRLNDYIKQLTPIREDLSRMSEYLTSVYKNSGYLIDDAKNEIELKRDLHKSVSSGNLAVSSALKIFKGDPEKRIQVNQSMDALRDNVAAKLANIKKAISYSSDFMRSIDLDNATYEKEGLKLIDEFEKDSSNVSHS